MKLVNETSLVDYPNGRGENILLFLAQTVGRQLVEQRQYKPSSRSRKTSAVVYTVAARKSAAASACASSDLEPEMPEHDLEPPR